MSETYISVETAIALAMQYCPDNDGVCSKSGHDLRELLDDLENAPPADVRPAWRSTETDPPKIGEPVLIARKIRHNETVLVEPAVLRPDGTWKAIGHKIKPSSVSHWMPMPVPPQEGEIC